MKLFFLLNNLYYYYIFIIIPTIQSLGLIISPTKDIKSNHKKLSSINNLQNCINYQTNLNDIIIINLSSIEKIHSQYLNLIIFDSSGNVLRNQKDLSKYSNKDFNLILKNTETNYINSNLNTNDNYNQNLIHICFDNLYNDLSWSFQPKNYEVEFDIKIKSNMEYTDYDIYKKYFNTDVLQQQQKDLESNEQQVDGESSFNLDLFEQKINKVTEDLNSIVENLQNSEDLLNDLKFQEFKLRDANESIFSGYTLISIILCVTIVICGSIQLLLYKFCIFKRYKMN